MQRQSFPKERKLCRIERRVHPGPFSRASNVTGARRPKSTRRVHDPQSHARNYRRASRRVGTPDGGDSPASRSHRAGLAPPAAVSAERQNVCLLRGARGAVVSAGRGERQAATLSAACRRGASTAPGTHAREPTAAGHPPGRRVRTPARPRLAAISAPHGAAAPHGNPGDRRPRRPGRPPASERAHTLPAAVTRLTRPLALAPWTNPVASRSASAPTAAGSVPSWTASR